MDCDSSFAYESRSFASKVGVGQLASAEFDSSKDAIRQVDQAVERYAQRWSTMCKEYNAGVIDNDAFNAQSKHLRETMERLDQLLVMLTTAPDAASFQAALREAYTGMVPEQSVDLEVELDVLLQRPGEADFTLAGLDASCPSGTKLRMLLSTTVDAHVYIYRVDPSGRVSVLFPDPDIGVGNPVPQATGLQLPPAPAWFTVDAQDTGREQVHVIASVEPLELLQASIARAREDATAVSVEQLECNARGLAYEVGLECPDSRGLVYDEGLATPEYSLKAVNAAADNAVHLIYSFDHSA